MKLQRLVLENFRNHSSTIINCCSGLNIILGNNGEGKTNILEGVSYFCLSRSFYGASDSVVVQQGKKDFFVTGEIFSDGGVEYKIRVEFDKELNQKIITVNKNRIDRVSSLIGQFPVVLLSPEQGTITFGPPVERRRFVDFVISQSNRAYLENLIDYRRILKQRNKILSNIQQGHNGGRESLEPWNESLCQIGSMIMKKRIEFIGDFQCLMKDAYTQLSGFNEKPGIVYTPTFEYNEKSMESLEMTFRKEIEKQIIDEQRIGYSLIGPHRDELVFQINKMNVKDYASQGQHKTFLIALKLAEYFYLKKQCNETPILLFDDVLSEMDEQRSKKLFVAIENTGQVFLTSTDERALDKLSVATNPKRKIFVKEGGIERVENPV